VQSMCVLRLRVTHHRLRVVAAAVLLGRERGRGVKRHAAAEGAGAREGRRGRVDGEEFGGGRGVVPAAPQEEKDAEGEQREEDEPADDTPCDLARMGLGLGREFRVLAAFVVVRAVIRL